MGCYVFLTNEPEDGFPIEGEVVEYGHIKREKLEDWLKASGREWADYYGEPVTCYRIEPVSPMLTDILPTSWEEEANWEHELRAREEDAL